MSVIAMIPARLESTRFPNKMLANLNGQSVILTTYLNAINTKLFDRVYVVTNSEDIAAEIKTVDGRVILDQTQYDCGTDRIAAVVHHITKYDSDIIINVQGDEPIMHEETLKQLISALQDGASAATVQTQISTQEAQNPNLVKVLTDNKNNALCFSRHPVPYQMAEDAVYWRHLGAYGFKKWALEYFKGLKRGPIERAESIEAWRFLENGVDLKMVNVAEATIGIDLPEDLEKVRKLLQK
jgi:3-deoxy-manno-octulosonate cytidylyltransferase (CMP-KDO synthetase)